ncbi:MAG: RNA-binding protein [Candidatus Nitrosopumilus sp. MTA1]|uniref:RNA-binding protein n=1 Tax=Marine Group I thaumarchaeote TaxID=2511932 RepID=A0A7K4MWR3_9ARCH|nr:RNA-binding protein [Candidatus Nitrosopumilus sp. MTA1]NWJ57353.1 RNA-binding protein [Marine Group I thaumarchaeote]NWJ84409.1 RNA-binding protein [Marine Group I thaumarchaeote]NWK01604.1 RNA-binding protein [Marine Group I thaumarchaeote]NWK14421.1 RNA-binding protein [Marine Group I thaumarchaeote]
MKSNLISKSETSEILKMVSEKWKIKCPKIKNLKVHQISDEAQIITGKGIKILKINDNYLPFLSETNTLKKFPNVIVDMGAVKFMCKGANVMRPGIKKFTEFEKDNLVCIMEESQHKFLAVGKAMVSSSELENIEKGEVLENLHYISDKFWDIGKTIYD